MQISEDGLELTKASESCSLESYPDPASPLGKACMRRGLKLTQYQYLPGWTSLKGDPWTIGWGHTGTGVGPEMTWDQAHCDFVLKQDLSEHEAAVMRLAKVPLKQCQFDALVDFAYNVGDDEDHDGKAEGLGDSTLLKMVNARNFTGAADQFLKWDKAGGVVLKGLSIRRARERALFLGINWRYVTHG